MDHSDVSGTAPTHTATDRSASTSPAGAFEARRVPKSLLPSERGVAASHLDRMAGLPPRKPRGKGKGTGAKKAPTKKRKAPSKDKILLKFLERGARREIRSVSDLVRVIKESTDSDFFEEGRPLRTPSQWRDLGERARVHFYALALERLGSGYAFHARLSLRLTEVARGAPGRFATFMRERIAKKLERQLKYAPQVWFMVEVRKGNDPHLHGAVLVSDENKPRARVGFLHAVGVQPGTKFARYAVRMRWQYRAYGVGNYASKSVGRTWYLFNKGRNLSATQKIVQAAKPLYEEVRREIMARRQEAIRRRIKK